MQTRNKKYCYKRLRAKQGFTLAEALAALTLAAVIMVTAIGIYTGVRRAESAINKRLESGFTATEILQRINEDIDRLAMPGSDVTFSIKNKLEAGGYKSAQMIMESKIYDKDNKPQIFEKIVWQSHADADSNGLVIYRAHGGYTLEDKMLEEPKEKFEREKYIPLSGGVTLFSITVGSDSNDVNQAWTGQGLPPSVKVSISYAQPQQDITGNVTVPPEEIKSRTIVIDRFRQVPYNFVYKEFGDANEAADVNDANLPPDSNAPEGLNEPNGLPERPNERRR